MTYSLNKMQRRTVLRFVGMGVLEANIPVVEAQLVSIAENLDTHKPQFFSPCQITLLEHLTEMIIPTDVRSPGAREAKVSYFIDIVVFYSAESIQKSWVTGLQAVERETSRLFNISFSEATSLQRDQIMERMAANEHSPTSSIELFFKRLKSATVDGYYTSAIGIHKELQYKGNTPQKNFLGCTHLDHE